MLDWYGQYRALYSSSSSIQATQFRGKTPQRTVLSSLSSIWKKPLMALWKIEFLISIVSAKNTKNCKEWFIQVKMMSIWTLWKQGLTYSCSEVLRTYLTDNVIVIRSDNRQDIYVLMLNFQTAAYRRYPLRLYRPMPIFRIYKTPIIHA